MERDRALTSGELLAAIKYVLYRYSNPCTMIYSTNIIDITVI